MDDLTAGLEQSEIFRGLPAEVLTLVGKGASRCRYKAGESLFRNGDDRSSMYIVLSGEIDLRIDDGDAPETLIVLGPGQAVGEAGLLEEGRHSADAVVVRDADVLEIPLEDTRVRLQSDAKAAITVMQAVGRVIVRRLRYARSRRAGWDHIYGPGETRKEYDLLGERNVPLEARYGVQTLRAVENFPITGIHIAHFPSLIRALAMVKQAAARANHALGLLPDEMAAAIDSACEEILDGHWHGHFVVDMLQGGAGTSTNMNANEVIANRALEIMGHPLGAYEHCHPNNHVNLSQSTNDVYPTALKVATIIEQRDLCEAIGELVDALRTKGAEFDSILKMGRTQLQDAVPMTLGQEFEAYAVTTSEDATRLQASVRLMLEINLGGTAIGTGINAEPGYTEKAVAALCEISGYPFVTAENLIEATADTGSFVHFSGVLKRVAVKVSKICNDLRLLSSGPRCGFGEINLPARQPGSSIMPGKVNPVIPEVVNQIAYRVIGNDLVITLAAEAGQLQLNVMEPVIAFSMFESMSMLTAGIRTLTARCIRGITANAEHCRESVERSIGLVTAVVPVLGYERASDVAMEALATGHSIREILLAAGDLSEDALNELLSPEAMTAPRAMLPHERRP